MEIAGHKPPTPGNADSPAQKKHREQVIVVGTLILVILTFVLVMRHGQNADASGGVTTDSGGGFAPGTDGGSGSAGDYGALPGIVGSVPGQTAALQQGNFNAILKRLKRQQQQLAHMRKRENRILARERKLQHGMHRDAAHHKAHHPKKPEHPIHHSAHSPMHGGSGRKGHQQHPPAHNGHRNTGVQHHQKPPHKKQAQTMRFGAVYSHKV